MPDKRSWAAITNEPKIESSNRSKRSCVVGKTQGEKDERYPFETRTMDKDIWTKKQDVRLLRKGESSGKRRKRAEKRIYEARETRGLDGERTGGGRREGEEAGRGARIESERHRSWNWSEEEGLQGRTRRVARSASAPQATSHWFLREELTKWPPAFHSFLAIRTG